MAGKLVGLLRNLSQDMDIQSIMEAASMNLALPIRNTQTLIGSPNQMRVGAVERARRSPYSSSFFLESMIYVYSLGHVLWVGRT